MCARPELQNHQSWETKSLLFDGEARKNAAFHEFDQNEEWTGVRSFLRLRSGSLSCCCWLKGRNSSLTVAHSNEERVHSLKKSNQLIHWVCQLMKTTQLNWSPCWVLKQVWTANPKMRMMGQECQLKSRPGRAQLAYQQEKMQMGCNSMFLLDD